MVKIFFDIFSKIINVPYTNQATMNSNQHIQILLSTSYIALVVRSRGSLVYIWRVDNLNFTTFVHMAINYYSIYGNHISLYYNYIASRYSYIVCICMPILACSSHIIIFQNLYKYHNTIIPYRQFTNSMYKNECQTNPLKRPYPAGYIQLHSEPGN